MARTDFIRNRIDVVNNIYKLFTYATIGTAEEQAYAIQRYKQGKWYVVELIGGKLFFAPSRFVGYLNNTKEKHTEDYGNGNETNNLFTRQLKLYKESNDPYLSSEFNLFLSRFNIEKNNVNFFIPIDVELDDLKRSDACYFISPTHCKGQKPIAWDSFRESNVVAIGWEETDYSNYSDSEINVLYEGDKYAQTAFKIIKQIKYGDIVCCTNNSYGLWGIGVAMSSYKFKEKIHCAGVDDEGNECYYSHYIDIAWLKFEESGYISKDKLCIKNESQWEPYGTISKKNTPNYIKQYIFNMDADTIIPDSPNKHYINLLKNNKNLILTGAPGTGKTYLAKKIIAQEIVGDADNDHIEFVQFHPSYDYTDFVEGLRAEKIESAMGGVTFTLRNGIFKSFCKRALNNPDENYVFIIDEINRGDMSKIFGELFFSIDPGYRGVDGKVKTQYENLHSGDTIFDEELGAGWFYVPKNVFIIGTMNDIDRSVESMDFAMRRRFTWVEVTAYERASMLDGNSWTEEAKEKMIAINKVITNIDGLGSAYHIGPAYFLKLESYKYQEESQMWDSLWKYHIYPLLSEYLRGMPNADEELTKLEAAYRNPKATVTNESQEN